MIETPAERLAKFRDRLVQTSARHNRLVHTDLHRAAQRALKASDVDVDTIYRQLSANGNDKPAGVVKFVPDDRGVSVFDEIPNEPADDESRSMAWTRPS